MPRKHTNDLKTCAALLKRPIGEIKSRPLQEGDYVKMVAKFDSMPRYWTELTGKIFEVSDLKYQDTSEYYTEMVLKAVDKEYADVYERTFGAYYSWCFDHFFIRVPYQKESTGLIAFLNKHKGIQNYA